ncbi:FG-GAP repeat domain-containing protein [Streptomyces sp. NPDC090022]|uniref:FG-GAP repeat domain-containing protein n=1 Tax=Streptomyces sp. NPDC090022 TaxID=3365920 RepID=UPI003805A2EE
MHRTRLRPLALALVGGLTATTLGLLTPAATAAAAPPAIPTALDTFPATPCSGGPVGLTSLSLMATVDVPDGPGASGYEAEFQVTRVGESAPAAAYTVPAARGRVTTAVLRDGTLPAGDYRWTVRAKDGAGQTSPWSAGCAFSLDLTRPAVPPKVSSEQFPERDGSAGTGTGKARTPGTFRFDAGGVEDVDHIVYSTDWERTEATVAPGGSVVITPPNAGPHYVHAYSVDRAGNRSDTVNYLFMADRTGLRDAPGDLDGDGHRDLWSVGADHRLRLFSGRGDGTFAAPVEAGPAFPAGAQAVVSGDWTEDGYNDLIAFHGAGGQDRRLWVHKNLGMGTSLPSDSFELSVFCPVQDPEMGCDSGNEHWGDAQAIAAAGDLDGDGGPELLVQQGKRLWVYFGGSGGYLDALRPPLLVGEADWDAYTVTAPGDTDGDGIVDLWLRHGSTGDLYRVSGAHGTDSRLDPTRWATAPRVKIGSGVTAAAFPSLGTAGDLTGDGLADLPAVDATGRAVYFRGTATGIDGAPVVVG